jgi:hypothetical protein
LFFPHSSLSQSCVALSVLPVSRSLSNTFSHSHSSWRSIVAASKGLLKQLLLPLSIQLLFLHYLYHSQSTPSLLFLHYLSNIFDLLWSSFSSSTSVLPLPLLLLCFFSLTPTLHYAKSSIRHTSTVPYTHPTHTATSHLTLRHLLW